MSHVRPLRAAWGLPDFAFGSTFDSPASGMTTASAWPVTAHPLAPARQLVVSAASPGAWAVTVTRQPVPAHSPVNVESDQIAGASFTGFAASLAAARASLRASRAVF